jgi:hypothetical protein
MTLLDDLNPNLVEWIKFEAKGESIEGVVIGKIGHASKIGDKHRNRVLKWSEAKDILDYDFCDGFGTADCDAVYAWTKTKVIFVAEYDGATRIVSVPRHPVDCCPEYM